MSAQTDSTVAAESWGGGGFVDAGFVMDVHDDPMPGFVEGVECVGEQVAGDGFGTMPSVQADPRASQIRCHLSV